MDYRELNLRLTKEDLKASIGKDLIIIQTIHTIDELIKIINKLVVNLRERVGYFFPRICKIEDINEFLALIKKGKSDDLGIKPSKDDLFSIHQMIEEIERLVDLREIQEVYLNQLMDKTCPRLNEIVGSLIGARLISLAGSLKHLASVPSSTIQTYGAEKALFRHLKTGSRAPKFGVIFAHENISKAKEKAKSARQLAAKISISVKMDYFRNEV